MDSSSSSSSSSWLTPFNVFLHLCPEILIAIACFFLLSSLRSSRSSTLPNNWPMLGMLPAIVANFHRLHDFVPALLRETGFTFAFNGPWFLNMDFLITCDPANVNHIFNVNFPNYPKGEEFGEIFDILGDGILNSDDDSWRSQRKMAQSILSDGKLRSVLAKASRDKVENGLIPFLDYIACNHVVVDLQDVFIRLAFDTTCDTVLGVDPGSLSVEFPVIPFAKAIDDAEEALLLRHVVPRNIWKAMRWLKIGSEKKLATAWEVKDSFILEQISKLREKKIREKFSGYDLMTLYMNHNIDDDKFLTDTALTFMLAGRDTISLTLAWFFYLVSTNPIVESKILNELTCIIQRSETKEVTVFDAKMLQSAVYLHAALCDSLRLYPPVPFEHKGVLETDVLPSGETVGAGSKILISVYSIGRMEGIWGKDCLGFKPERWISASGKLRHEPSYKFLAFNCGPRTCLGREIAFTQLKIVAAAIIYNFRIELVDGHVVVPKNSVVLHMKNGMQARVRKR